jgi:hypothetical protein
MTVTDPSDTNLLQQLTNRRLNGREPLQCNACGRQLHEEDTVVIRLHYDLSDQTWLTTGRFCTSCGPETTQGPKPFAAEVVARGRVGSAADAQSQEHFPILLSPEIVDRA